MSVSLIINTCALQEREVLSSGKVPHSWRAYALRNFILPYYINHAYIDQLIVVGTWEPGEGYEYVPQPSVYFNCADALIQRQAGFAYATGDTVIFSHDDHLLELEQIALPDVDVISPARYTRLRHSDGERIMTGWNEYIFGHVAIYRRAVIDKCPWISVPPQFTWDMHHTKAIREAGFNIQWTDNIRCWDVEYGSEPWK